MPEVADTEVEILVEQTRSERYGELKRGQKLTVTQTVAEHWERFKIAKIVTDEPPPKQGAKPEAPPAEKTEWPCKHPDCIGREPFKSEPAHRGHVTRQHNGKETPPVPAAS